MDLRAQKLCQSGYVVMRLDNRGSYRRGLKFESKIRHNMGDLEVKDQVHGVRTLIKEKLVDSKRVGMYVVFERELRISYI